MKKTLSILLILFTSTIYAWGNRAGDITFSGGGAYYWFANKRAIENDAFAFGIVGFDLSDLWSVEAMYGGFVTFFDDRIHDDRRINASLFTIDAVYRFGDFCRFEPYVLGGFGILGLSHNRNEANNEGNINLGLGAQYFIADTLAFRADVRDIYTIVGGKNDVMADFGMSLLFSLC